MTPSPSPVAAVLAELEGLLAKAYETPLPWSVTSERVYDANNSGVADTDAHDDAALIVAAVNVLPRLLAAIRAVDELADDMKARGLRAQSAARLFENANIAPRVRSRGLALSGAADQIRSALAAVDVAEATE